MTPFALLCGRCGLSHREAADFLGVRIDTAKSWSSGRNPTPEGVIAQLRDLARKIERAAKKYLSQKPDAIELRLASTDAEAQSLGWPCIGAHAAVLGTVIAASDLRFRIVPRRQQRLSPRIKKS